jgi:hypothetical protein
MVEALTNIFASIPSTSFVQLKGYSIEVASLFPQIASFMTPGIAIRLAWSLWKHLDDSRMNDVLGSIFRTKLICAEITSLQYLLLQYAKVPKPALRINLYSICESAIAYALQNPQAASGYIINQMLSHYITKHHGPMDFFDRPSPGCLLQGNLGGFIEKPVLASIPTFLIMIKYRDCFANLDQSTETFTMKMMEYFLKENLNSKRKQMYPNCTRRLQHHINKLLAL